MGLSQFRVHKIYENALIPAFPLYDTRLRERRSHAFPHDYTPGYEYGVVRAT